MKYKALILQYRARLAQVAVRFAHRLHFHSAKGEAERIAAEFRTRRSVQKKQRLRRRASAYFPGGQP